MCFDGSSTTAAATTGPARHPRPTSSPAVRPAAIFPRLPWHPLSCSFRSQTLALLRDQLAQNLLLLVVERRDVQQVRPPLERSSEGLFLSPPPDLGVVARQQNVRH